MKKLTILAVCLYVWAGLCPTVTAQTISPVIQLAQTQQAIPNLSTIRELAQSATRQKFPNADSALLWDATVARYNEQGLGEEYSHSFTKIMTEKGIRDNRQIALHFSATYGSVKILKLAIHRPGQSAIKLNPARLSKISISSGQMGQNIYDPQQKVLRVGVPGLNVGDVLEMAWQRTTVKARIPGMWSNYLLLQYNEPILHTKIVVDAPQTLPLRKIAVKGDIPGNPVKFTETRQGNRIIYAWHAQNAPQIIPEPSMPEIFSCARRLLLSTAPSWESVSKWYAKLCRPALDAVDSDMKNFVQKLVADHQTDRDKVRALFLFVSQQIRYMGLTTETAAPGYEPHPVKVTFHNRYGVCRDKAALLAAMLEMAGFKAYPTLIMVGDPKDDEVPNNYFNHAVVAWENTPGHYELLDPTYESTTEFFPALQMNMSYLVAKKSGEKLLRTPVIPPEKNSMSITTTGNIDFAGTLHAVCRMDFGGVNDLFYRNAFSVWSMEQKKQFFNLNLRKNFPGAEVTELSILPANIRDMNTKLQAQIKFQVTHFLPQGRRTFLVPLPQLSDHFGALNYIFENLDLTQRRFPLKFDSTCEVREKFELQLPQSVEMLALPNAGKGDFQISGVYQNYNRLAWQSAQKLGGKIRGERRKSLSSLQITPEQYLQLKRQDAHAQAAAQALPVARTNYRAVPATELAKIFADANSLILSSDLKIRVISPTEYEITTEIERFVLNYAGVKKFSEVKIPYNPSVTQVREFTASVTTPQGAVKKLQSAEKNLMDAAWNAAAPRYPGSKILVVNLPSVTPGAIIKTRSTLRHQVPFIALSLPLTGFSPAAQRHITLDTPRDMRLQFSELPGNVRYWEKEELKTNRLIRHWTCRDTARLKREIHMAPSWLFAPHLAISNGDYHTYGRATNQALQSKAVVTPAIQKFVAAQKWATLPTPEAQIKAVRFYVDKFIRAAGPQWGEIALTALSATPDVTLKSGYGNSADRAILTSSLLRALGIESRFVLASSLGYTPQVFKHLCGVPDVTIFDEVLLYLPQQQFYLNDSTRYAPLGSSRHEEHIILDLARGRLQPLHPGLHRDTDKRFSYKIECQANHTATIKVVQKLYGNAFASLHAAYMNMTPELRQRFFNQLALAISPEAVITGTPDADFSGYPGRLSYQVNVPNFIADSGATPQGQRLVSFELPGFHRFGTAIKSAGGERTTPMWRNAPERFQIDYQITLPRNAKVVPGRAARRTLGQYGSTIYQENYFAKGNQLHLECRIVLPTELIKPQNSATLAQIQQDLNSLSSRRVILQLKRAAPRPRR